MAYSIALQNENGTVVSFMNTFHLLSVEEYESVHKRYLSFFIYIVRIHTR